MVIIFFFTNQKLISAIKVMYIFLAFCIAVYMCIRSKKRACSSCVQSVVFGESSED